MVHTPKLAPAARRRYRVMGRVMRYRVMAPSAGRVMRYGFVGSALCVMGRVMLAKPAKNVVFCNLRIAIFAAALRAPGGVSENAQLRCADRRPSKPLF